MKKSSIVMLVILVAIFAGALGILGYKYITEKRAESREEKVEEVEKPKITEVAEQKEESREEGVEAEKIAVDYSQKGLYDKCLGINAYANKDFYNDLIAAIKPIGLSSSGTSDTYIEDACYSSSLEKVLLLINDVKGICIFDYYVIEYDIASKSIKKSNIQKDGTCLRPTVFGLRQEKEIEMIGEICGRPMLNQCTCEKSVHTYNLETQKITKKYEKTYTPTKAEAKEGTELRDIYDEVCKWCNTKPEMTDIGRHIFQTAPQYSHLKFLGQIFTMAGCTEARWNEIWGVENGIYTLGSNITLAHAPNSDLIKTLHLSGFNCNELKKDSQCINWKLLDNISVTKLQNLKEYASDIERDDCVNCG